MRLRATSHIPVLIAVTAFLAAACTDGPTTSVTDASAPNFGHRPGHEKGGGGGGGGKGGATVEVEFLSSVSLFSSAPDPDYLSGPQIVKGSDSKRQIAINDVPFELTVGYPGLEPGSCEPAPGSELEEDDGRLAGLVALTQPLSGLLGIHVFKRNLEGGQESETGVVVNFTYIDDTGAVGQAGDEFFLTTGRGRNLLQEEQGQSRVAKTDGFVRINRNGNPNDAVICYGVVDFEFTVTK